MSQGGGHASAIPIQARTSIAHDAEDSTHADDEVAWVETYVSDMHLRVHAKLMSNTDRISNVTQGVYGLQPPNVSQFYAASHPARRRCI